MHELVFSITLRQNNSNFWDPLLCIPVVMVVGLTQCLCALAFDSGVFHVLRLRLWPRFLSCLDVLFILWNYEILLFSFWEPLSFVTYVSSFGFLFDFIYFFRPGVSCLRLRGLFRPTPSLLTCKKYHAIWPLKLLLLLVAMVKLL